MKEQSILVRIVQDYAVPDLLRQTPGSSGVWDGIRYTMEPVEACDYLIVLRSQMKNPIAVSCPRENVWALVQDPYVPGFNDWLVEGYDNFARVFTPSIYRHDNKFILSQPALPWYVNRSYDELTALPVPAKPKPLSWIVGSQRDIPGHFKRKRFLDFLKQKQAFGLDLFGRGAHYLADKADGLLPYRYSLAVENSSIRDYWTEKIADCFLCWTVPIYYGCLNLETYFPPESFIRIDINRPEEALQTIIAALNGDGWDSRLPALQEARELVLNKYQFFPHFSPLIRQESALSKISSRIEIPLYKRSLPARIRRMGYKTTRSLRRLYYGGT